MSSYCQNVNKVLDAPLKILCQKDVDYSLHLLCRCQLFQLVSQSSKYLLFVFEYPLILLIEKNQAHNYNFDQSLQKKGKFYHRINLIFLLKNNAISKSFLVVNHRSNFLLSIKNEPNHINHIFFHSDNNNKNNCLNLKI